MTFPVYFHILGRQIHPHLALELLAYTAGSQLYFYLRRRWARTGRFVPLDIEQNLWLIVGCVMGALVGAKVLAAWENLPMVWEHRANVAAWISGKTIAGGLLGGWIGVELVKWRLGIRRSTGDLFVFPLIAGISIGRVGCFLTGLDDYTCGAHTSVPWAVDFGDGPRHPNQLYEIATVLLIGTILLILQSRRPLPDGFLFRFFLLGYLTYRFTIEFLHWPRINPYLGLSAIQIACLAGIGVLGWQLARSNRRPAVQMAENHN